MMSFSQLSTDLPFDVEILVADHVDENQSFQIVQLFVANAAINVMPASINTVGISPFNDGLFSIKENEFERVVQL
jgi:hypothetical protein